MPHDALTHEQWTANGLTFDVQVGGPAAFGADQAEAFVTLEEHIGRKLFRTTIRSSIAYAESAERGVSILDHRPDLAADYLARNHVTDRPCRFDVVAIDGVGEARRLVLYRHAFTA